jgi:hypothetical protein
MGRKAGRMSCDMKKCIYCVNFIYKLMLNGYDGVCDKDGKMVGFVDACDDFLPWRNEMYRSMEQEGE